MQLSPLTLHRMTPLTVKEDGRLHWPVNELAIPDSFFFNGSWASSHSAHTGTTSWLSPTFYLAFPSIGLPVSVPYLSLLGPSNIGRRIFSQSFLVDSVLQCTDTSFIVRRLLSHLSFALTFMYLGNLSWNAIVLYVTVKCFHIVYWQLNYCVCLWSSYGRIVPHNLDVRC